MRPVCESCFTEMQPQGRAVTLGYQHNHAPVDYTKALQYHCPGCSYKVFMPIGYSYGSAVGEPKDCIPVNPSNVKPEGPAGRLP